MKTIATVFAFLATVACGLAQFRVSFNNTASTLISAEDIPLSPTERFRFALFLGPATAVGGPGIPLPFDDPRFQLVDAYTTNHPSAAGAGRLRNQPVNISPSRLDELGFWNGLHVDFVVRGWSENAGMTWSEALANWNDGSPSVPMFIGSSTVGNDLTPSAGALPDPVIFGTWPVGQVLGFNMTFVPEPSALVVTVLGGTALWASARRKKREPS